MKEERKPLEKWEKQNRLTMAVVAGSLTAALAAAGAWEYVQDVILPGRNYNQAMELMGTGGYAQAISVLADLGSYKDAPEQILACRYAIVEADLAATGDREAAAAAFEALGYLDSAQRAADIRQELWDDACSQAQALLDSGDYAAAADAFGDLDQHEKVKECRYRQGMALLAAGESGKAAEYLRQAEGYADSLEQLAVIWESFLQRETFAISNFISVAIRQDGSLIATGNDGIWLDVKDWTDIVAVAAGDFHTVGLRSDGTVAVTGTNVFGQCDVEDWTDIVDVAACCFTTVGLKADGTLVTTGANENGKCDVAEWTNIIDVVVSENLTVGLKLDGTVVAAGALDEAYDFSFWTDITAIAVGSDHIVGLRSDGTVVATGHNEKGQCNVEDWTDVVDIAAGGWHTAAAKADGTVVAVGLTNRGQCYVAPWQNVEKVFVCSAGTVGIRQDGSVCSSGNNWYGQLSLWGWKNLMI